MLQTNQTLPSGGSDQTVLMLSSQTKLLNFPQFSLRKNPSGADCWIHVEEPDNENMLISRENSSYGDNLVQTLGYNELRLT